MALGLPEILIILILLGVFIALPVWIVRRLRSRPCPRCGQRVKKGVLTCQECGFDFSTVGATPRG